MGLSAERCAQRRHDGNPIREVPVSRLYGADHDVFRDDTNNPEPSRRALSGLIIMLSWAESLTIPVQALRLGNWAAAAALERWVILAVVEWL